jgi:hypothetical protein
MWKARICGVFKLKSWILVALLRMSTLVSSRFVGLASS